MITCKETKKRSKFAIFSVSNRFVIKDLNEEQWYVRMYKGNKTPNFVSCTGYAKKYKFRLIAQIRAWLLGNCVVETCC